MSLKNPRILSQFSYQLCKRNFSNPFKILVRERQEFKKVTSKDENIYLGFLIDFKSLTVVCNKKRKTQYEHLNIVFQNLNCL